MKPIRYAVIGSGWRAEFYARIAQKLPDQFNLCMLLCRTEEKAARLRQELAVPASTREEDVISSRPDFLVSAVSKVNMTDTVIYWMKKGFPVLSETPAGLDFSRLEELWALTQKSGCRMQVAEQYWLYPSWDAKIRLLQSGILGDSVSVHLSAMHDYHAASIIRHLLGTGLEEVQLTGKTFSLPVTDTRTRYAVLTDGAISQKDERHVILEYESRKTAFYDFPSDQYRSPIRNRTATIRGTRGEIIGDTVYYLDGQNLARQETIQSRQDPASGEILSITFNGESLYTPVFGPCGLPEDETAIARLLLGMKEYVDTGREIYPMAEALEDAYIGSLMNQISPEKWYSSATEPRPWKAGILQKSTTMHTGGQ